MRKFFLRLVVPGISLFGAGCAQVPPVQDTVAPAAAAVTPAAAPPQAKTPPPAPPPIPPDVMYQVLVAEVAAHRGYLDVSMDTYAQLARQYRDVGMAERATRLALYARDDQKAREAARFWVEMDPANTEARQIVTVLSLKAGETDAAREQLDYLISHAPGGEEDGLDMTVDLLSRHPDKQTALKLMEQLAAARKDQLQAQYAYAQLAVRLGALPEAETSADGLLKVRPDWSEAAVLRARVYQMQGRPVEGGAYLERFLEQHPKDALVRAAYARLLVDAKQSERALKQFKLVAKQEPDNPDVLLALGWLSVELNQVDEGENYLLRLNRSGAHFLESAYLLGRINEDFRNNPRAAVEWYTKVDRGDNYLEAQIRIALLLAKQGDVELARAQLHAIRVQGPAQALRLYMAEGMVLRDAARYEEAAELYTEALKDIPDNLELLYARAMTHEKLNRVDKMEEDLRRILARDPNNIDALNSLGYTLADRTDRHQEALDLVQKALDLKPDSHYILDSMGWVQFRLGHTDEAVQYLRKALEINRDPEVAAHLIEVLWVTGKKQEAQELWQSSIQAAPGNPVLQEVMERLDPKKDAAPAP